jgi:hypothetical protein
MDHMEECRLTIRTVLLVFGSIEVIGETKFALRLRSGDRGPTGSTFTLSWNDLVWVSWRVFGSRIVDRLFVGTLRQFSIRSRRCFAKWSEFLKIRLIVLHSPSDSGWLVFAYILETQIYGGCKRVASRSITVVQWSSIPESSEDQHALQGESTPPKELGGIATARHSINDDPVSRHMDVGGSVEILLARHYS